MIEVKNISFKYAGSKHLVFDDFSLRLEEDRIYGSRHCSTCSLACCALSMALFVAMQLQQKTACPKRSATSSL